MKNSPVIYRSENRIAMISLNRPDNRNSMDEETMPAFEEALSKVKKFVKGKFCLGDNGPYGYNLLTTEYKRKFKWSLISCPSN